MKRSICTTATTIALFGALLSPMGGLAPAAAAPVPPTVSDISTKLLGKTVFLDPGHQGGGTAAQMDQLVDNGRGGRKPCQTSGMTALGGVPEHTITWRVAQLVKSSLQNLGARVVLSRPDDVSWGGCITDRARAAGTSGASVAVSIHADGAPAGDHGFHFIVPQLPIPNPLVNAVQSTQGRAATLAVRDAYLHFGFQPANYAGTLNGLQTRSDIAGPALTPVPDVFVEMGNGANPGDATSLTTPQGQLRHALAITTGLVAYLRNPQAGGPVSQPLPTQPDVEPTQQGTPSGVQLPAGAPISAGGVHGAQIPSGGVPPLAGDAQLPASSQPSSGGMQSPAGGAQTVTGGVQSPGGGVQSSTGAVPLSGGGVQNSAGGVQSSGAGVQGSTGGSQLSGGGVQSSGAGVQGSTGGSQLSGGGVQSSGGGVQTSTGGSADGVQSPGGGVQGSAGGGPSGAGEQGRVSSSAQVGVAPGLGGGQAGSGAGYPAAGLAGTAPLRPHAVTIQLLPLLSALGVRLPAGFPLGAITNGLVAGLLSTLASWQP